jgi:hypothetical protein
MRTVALGLLLVACEPVPTSSTSPVAATTPAIAVPRPDVPDVRDQRFVDTIYAATDLYSFWGKLDEGARAAPIPCSAGAMGRTDPGPVRMSAAADGPHVKKLYYLYPSAHDVYAQDGSVPVGFTIVKEAYAALPITGKEMAERNHGFADDPTTITVDGKHYAMGDRTELFAMMKVDATEGTDRHWIYAILDTDRTVRAVGRIERCMKCHEDATHERLFGVVTKPRPARGIGFGPH